MAERYTLELLHNDAKLDRIIDLLYLISRQIERGFTMTQADIDAATAAINAVADELGTVDTEIQALKAANPGVDTSALEAAVGRVKSAADVDLSDAAAPADTSAPVTTTPAPVQAVDDLGQPVQ